MHKKRYSSPDIELINYTLSDVLATSVPKPTEEFVTPIFTPEEELDTPELNQNP